MAAALGLSEAEFELALWAAGASIAWLIAVGVVYLMRRPPEPPVGPRTLDLGPEPPAVANFLINDFRLTGPAMQATLLDLAARDVVEVEQRGLGVFYVRLRPAREVALTAYEERVLKHLREKASDGVIPAQALTTGRAAESQAWWRGFEREVVADAKERGLSRDALDRGLFGALLAAAAFPAIFVWALSEFGAAMAVMLVGLAILSWAWARHPQRETARGLEAASRWLGVRAAIAENEEFGKHSPLTVEIWDRVLAYGAALGIAPAAAGPLAMGTESDTRAWTAHGGRWREVRVAYPHLWPVGWGRHPLVAFGLGAAMILAPLLLLQAGFWDLLTDGGGPAILFLLLPCSVIAVGAAIALMALLDLSATREVSGPILRLRVFGDDNKRHYVAIDDGTSSEIRALRVKPALYAGLGQGAVVAARMTRHLRCVRSITPAGPPLRGPP